MPLLATSCLLAAALAADGDNGPFTHRTQPLEAVPIPSTELVERLRQAPPLRAEVVRGALGWPELRLDGRAAPVLGAQQMGLGYPKDRIHIRPYLDGGIRLIMVSVNAGFQHRDSGHVGEHRYWPTFWEGAGSFRPEVVEPELWRTVAMDPEAAILVRIWMTPYPRWTAEHPEAVIRNLHGHPLVVSSHFLRFDPAGPSPDPARHEQLAGSFHSEDLLRDMEGATEELVRAIEACVPGRRVAGYFIGGGQDGQLYDWAPPDGDLARDAALWSDFSPAAQAAWRRWLERRYATPQALGAAWGRTVAAFADAPLPAADDLVGSETLHHPVRGRIAIDWNRFTADARGELVVRMARAAKRAAKRPVVVGAPAGWSARKDLAQAARLLREPAIDFLRHQIAYSQRQPGLVGGVNAQLASHHANGKIFLADVDHPTWLVEDGRSMRIGAISQTSLSQGRADGPESLAAMWRREHGMLAAEGAGTLIHPILGGPWMYRHPAVVQEFRLLDRLYRGIRPGAEPVPEMPVAWVFDERSLARLKTGLLGVGFAWAREQQNELLACGAPFRGYYAEDLEEGLVAPARVVLLPNLLDLTPALARGLERLKGGGRILVFGQSTGHEQLARGEEAAVAAATGLRLVPAARAAAAPAPADPARLALLDPAWAPAAADGTAGAALLDAMVPPADGWRTLPDIAQVNGATLMQVKPDPARALHLRAQLRLERESDVWLRLRADWWAEARVDGRPLLRLDRTQGGSAARPVWAATRLAAGSHRLEVRLVSGSGGFRCALAAGLGAEPPLGQEREWDEDAGAGVVVDDPAARILARHPSGRPAVVAVDHGDWTAVHVAAWSIPAATINRLVRQAGGWTACPADAAVVAAGSGVLMLHALRDGPLQLSLPAGLALEPLDGSEPMPAASSHRLDLRRGQTGLWWLGGRR